VFLKVFFHIFILSYSLLTLNTIKIAFHFKTHSKVILNTGVGVPSAWQCSSVPEEFENLIFVDGNGSETNFGPTRFEPLKPSHEAPSKCQKMCGI
jgi:hypothetical protein